MKVLVLNAGSSSLKYQLFNMEQQKVLCSGYVEKIGMADSFNTHKIGDKKTRIEKKVGSHKEALEFALELISSGEDKQVSSLSEIVGVGHRVVHGGETKGSMIIDKDAIKAIRDAIPLAPLHNPANLVCIEGATEVLPNAVHVAVCDTTFHSNMPARAYTYAIPKDVAHKYKVRRYGFHGTSHKYVAERAAEILGKPLEKCNLITLHIGNGCSLCAIEKGVSVDTSMGLTPLEGVVMGTRSGSIDPAIIPYLCRQAGMTPDDVETMLNKKSGLLGVSGTSSDARDIEDGIAKGDKDAILAQEVQSYSIKKVLGAYMAVLGHVDAIIFTAGLGENAPIMRAGVCEGLEPLGIVLDAEKNKEKYGPHIELSAPQSKIKIFAIRTNEELEIANETKELMGKRK